MKNRKAMGPDDIPIEAWKLLGSLGVLMLTDLFSHILDTGKTIMAKAAAKFQYAYFHCIWWALRSKGSLKPTEIIRDMYHVSTSMVRTAVGDTKSFQISIDVHQGSALRPVLFNVVLYTVSAYIQDQPPYLMMYVDDIAFF